MNVGLWKRVQPILEDALELAAEDRGRFLDEACGSDHALRNEIENLLNLPLEPASRKRQSRLPKVEGYELIDQIGDGGMGVVYAARQTGAVIRHVAVKILRSDVKSAELVQRFDRERQTHADLDHPNIAPLLDAGETESGQPFYTMPLVAGEAITKYCDSKNLVLENRLRLFEQVCQAVHYANGREKIHRDLKPSNVLVRDTDEGPVPVVIDFGVAKILGDTASATLTGTHQLVGTIAYASPEQVTNPTAVDIRTDVYGLGNILYELLSGEHPLALDDDTMGYDEKRQRLIEKWPLPPSVAVSKMHSGDAKRIAEKRQTTNDRLVHRFKTGLDGIALKALEKSPQRRYQTVGELGQAIEDFRKGRPISTPTTSWYRIRAFATRHRLATAASAVVLSVLLGSIGFLSWHQHKLSKERDRAALETRKAERAVSELEVASNFFASYVRRSDSWWSSTSDPEEYLVVAATEAEKVLAEHPAAFSSITGTIASSFLDRGDLATAAKILKNASSHDSTHLTLVELQTARLKALQSKYDESIEIIEHIQDSDAHRSDLNEQHQALAYTIRGQSLTGLARFSEAIDEHQKALVLLSPSRQPLDRIDALLSSATTLYQLGQAEEAEEAFRQALNLQTRIYGDDHPQVARSLNGLGTVALLKGEETEAEIFLRRAFSIVESKLSPEHVFTAQVLNNIAVAGSRSGEDDIHVVFEDAIQGFKVSLGDRHPEVATSLNNLGVHWNRSGNSEKALEAHAEALSIRKAALPEDHPSIGTSYNNLAIALDDLGRADEALELKQRALGVFEKAYGPSSRQVGTTLNNLGSSLQSQNRYSEAESYFRRALNVHQNSEESGASLIITLNNLAALSYRAERFGEARHFYKQAVDSAQELLGELHWLSLAIRSSYARTLSRLGEVRRAEEIGRTSLNSLLAQFQPDHLHVAKSKWKLGGILIDACKLEEARQLLDQAGPTILRSSNDPGIRRDIASQEREYEEAIRSCSDQP